MESWVSDFLVEPRIAVVGSYGEDGRVTLSPVWYEWDGAKFVIWSEAGSRKVAHVRSQGRLAICVDDRDWPYRSVGAECSATVERDLDGFPVDLAERYLAGSDLVAFLERYGEAPCCEIWAVPTRWYGQ